MDLNETTELWWHLLDEHGLGPHQVHGDPVLIHNTLHAGIIKVDHEHDEGPRP
jgi:hypothetical protein